MSAIRILGGPRARKHVAAHGLQASDLRAIAAAAGGPKGLALIPFDRWLFGEFLTSSVRSSPLLLAGVNLDRSMADGGCQPEQPLAST